MGGGDELGGDEISLILLAPYGVPVHNNEPIKEPELILITMKKV